MGPAPLKNVPCAKGAICYCLDQFSRGRGARSRIIKLRDAIMKLAPNYAGLSQAFDEYLVAYVFPDKERRQRISAYLDTYWFVSGVPTTYFPTTPVARIYAEGVLETLELSLKGSGRPVPINSWWVLDADDFKMLNLANLKDGVTVGGDVTLLIMTPRPEKSGRAVPPWILGVEAEAYVTERQGRSVTTRRVRDL